MVVMLIIAGIVLTSLILTSNHHNYWGAFSDSQELGDTPATASSKLEEQLSKRLAIIFPINNNTDMQFYKNTWMREYLYPVCDWSEPGCKIVCNKDSTYHTLEEKTFCFSREIKSFTGKEFFIKLDDDAFVDRDYVFDLMREHTGAEKPVYISDHTRFWDPDNKVLNNVRYGNGKFYMFNSQLVKCLDTDLDRKYEHHPRNEDAVFGGMVNSGCGEDGVTFVQENDDKIWHKEYKSKNKYIDLGFIKNH
ncbi:hypothetical protein IWW38_001755 [Coemansia aciculifera]|uniref:Uncharacterized protein n=1 Tax=Coemansia aciculifera TaxID=417176 RepID=A0ACC1M646_9FUNG|nr:hypothetical protein IWW38_001755 [Coemansia aciculifera]